MDGASRQLDVRGCRIVISDIFLTAGLNGEFSDKTRSYAGKGVVGYTW
jgi:hypothetical protein